MSDALIKLEERVRELEVLQQNYLILNKTYHAPERFIEGMVVYADGTSWDPRVGHGIYQRRGNQWILLASPQENNTWEVAQYGDYANLTSSSGSIAIDLQTSNNFKHTLTEDTTLAAPSNAVAGQAGVIEFTQHASSPKTLAFNAFWKWPGGTDGTLTATNSAIDVLSYIVDSSATFATCVMLGDIK